MSFGKNPYVSKAQAAELKAAEAGDAGARERAHREAAHEWERAAARENPGKRRTEYLESAERNRQLAERGDEDAATASDEPAPASKTLLN